MGRTSCIRSTLRGNTTYVSPCATQAMHTMGNLPQMVVSLCLCQSSKASQSLLVRTPRSLLAEVAHGALYTRQLMMQDTFPREVMIRLLASWVARLVPATVNSPGSMSWDMAEMIYPTVKATYNVEWVAQASYNKFSMERFWEAADIEKLEKIHKKYDPCNILWVSRGIGHDQPHCAAAARLP